MAGQHISSTSQLACADVGLVDMPDPWLASVLAARNHEARIPLMQTCTAMRDLVLSTYTTCARLYLPLLPGETRAALDKLQLTCKYAQSTKLLLSRAPACWRFTNISASGGRLLFGVRGATGRGLATIKSVQLQDLPLDALVPTWLNFTCPNMTSLQLLGCNFSTLPFASVPVCGQLKQLHLHFSAGLCEQLLPSWQQQLAAVTGLQSLSLSSRASAKQHSGFLACCAAAVSTQLTRLTIDNTFFAQLAPSIFSNVSSLMCAYTTVTDADLDLLLSMSNLKQLQCHRFDLQHSHTSLPCSWVQLSVHKLDLASFAHLPLDSVRSFHLTPPHSSSYVEFSLSNDLEDTQRLVAIMNGHLHWDGVVDRLTVNIKQGIAPAYIAAAMPLLAACNTGVKHVQIACADQVTPELLAPLMEYVAHLQPTNLIARLSFSPGTCPLVLPSLPSSVRSVTLWDVAEAELIGMCVRACRPIQVSLHSQCGKEWQAGWHMRLWEALHAAGHQYVTLGVA